MISTLAIVPEEKMIDPTKAFIYSYAKPFGLRPLDWERLQGALERVLRMMIENVWESWRRVPITISVYSEDQMLMIKFVNLGRPLYIYKLLKMQLEQELDHFAYLNLGRQGQEFCLGIKLSLLGPSLENSRVQQEIYVAPEEITICELKRKQASKLSKLFYNVYGYRYIHEYVYFPDEIENKMAQGDLISHVATLPDGQIVGHVGLVRINKDPVVYEAALGVVDPTIKSQKLFSRLFKKTIEVVDSIPMQYCLYDFVTNHNYSQRLVYKYQSCEMSIMLGAQVGSTQAKLEELGLGQDPLENDRYSLLMAIRPQVSHPFGKEVVLPVNLGEMLEFLLPPLGLKWVAAPRFYLLPTHGEYRVSFSQEQKALAFDLFKPGRDVLEKIVEEWHHYMRLGYQYVSLDVPLDFSGIGQLYDFFSKKGFFISGLIPYQKGTRLALRLQALSAVRLSFDQIHLFSDQSKKLLSLIQQDYARNHHL